MEKSIFHIFLTDDDDDDRLFFSEVIDEICTETSLKLFNDGQELMDYLLLPDSVLPNLLLLDLNMPKKNGMQCLCEIRSNPKLKDLFIAIYSTSSSEKDIDETYANGANIYLNKPNSFGKLREMVEKVLQLDFKFHNANLCKKTFLFRN
ncbi:response regulator [Mariniflexile maritimum]|jgi:CheY-like chemotaxis protein|uniref:response regulator n=1 Tax=Mariniflexile maritimum TaxID=2682493 RepID=UPI0012F6BF17|nr:response regulator [Mariniflexile maritimum]MCB0449831.1 response regulator [Confluentibacter sp.]HMQ45787.1 response regulator [Mariniflexile sp.]HMR14867.1 response regulator [Mariniflexile sp.]